MCGVQFSQRWLQSSASFENIPEFFHPLSTRFKWALWVPKFGYQQTTIVYRSQGINHRFEIDIAITRWQVIIVLAAVVVHMRMN